ncbi:MAG: hypothetical protein WDZ93_02365 [Candidatus Paceibacterota bacterium]
MPAEPTVKPLSYNNRTWTFWTLLLVFLLAMPVFVFYATGYRIDFANDRNIITVGGLYVSADADDVLMFVNEEPVVNMRMFQQAAYIQNLDAGIHRIHVQKDGLATWVKELPVYSHIVTEAHAFNMPVIPQVRYIPEWLNAAGLPVLITEPASQPNILMVASTTNRFVATTSPSTRSYTANTEYEYVESLFATTTDTTNVSGTPRRALDVSLEELSFTDTDEMGRATTTRLFRDAVLFRGGEDVFVTWSGSRRNIPYYYCVMYTGPEQTIEEYGEHVFESLVADSGVTVDLADPAVLNTRLCRDTIRIDRDGQEVRWFDFLPGSMHHVLMLVEDGLYVVEADDRAWQNMQVLYPGEDLMVQVDAGRIYVYNGEHYMEVATEIAP